MNTSAYTCIQALGNTNLKKAENHMELTTKITSRKSHVKGESVLKDTGSVSLYRGEGNTPMNVQTGIRRLTEEEAQKDADEMMVSESFLNWCTEQF